MKTKLLFLGMLLSLNLTFGQPNQSINAIGNPITPIGSVAAGTAPPCWARPASSAGSCRRVNGDR